MSGRTFAVGDLVSFEAGWVLRDMTVVDAWEAEVSRGRPWAADNVEKIPMRKGKTMPVCVVLSAHTSRTLGASWYEIASVEGVVGFSRVDWIMAF